MPPWWHRQEFVEFVLTWTLGSPAIAFLIGAAVVALRFFADRRDGTHVVT